MNTKLPTMDLIETRRQNLRMWTSAHGTPVAEKSLFSQLKGNGSFGEKVARRLERMYEMGAGYLDQPIQDETQREEGTTKPAEMFRTSTATLGKKKLPKTQTPVSADVLAEMNVITDREAQLLNWYRMATDSSKEIIEHLARTIEKEPLSAIVDDEAERRLSGA